MVISTLGRKVLIYLKPYRHAFIFALLQLLLIGVLELAKPWPIKLVLDNVLGGKPVAIPLFNGFSRVGLLAFSCLALVFIYLLLGVASFISNKTTITIGQKMVNDLRRDLYAHLQRLSLSFHSRRDVGDLLYRVTADTLSIQTLTMNGIFPIVSATGLLIGMFIIMVRLDVGLTILALSVCPLMLGSIWLLNRKIDLAATTSRQRESAVYSMVQRAMSSIKIIQAFTKEEDEHRQFMKSSEASLAAQLRLYNLQMLYGAVLDVVIAVGTALILWVGARHVLSGVLSIGELVVFISYLASLYGPINSIFQTYGLSQAAKVGVKRVLEILEIDKCMPEGKRVFPLEGATGEIGIRNIGFEYAAGQPVLKNISLEIRPGQKIAIVGPTGAGKSTLVSLLPRFYDPQNGSVTFDGVDIREYQLKSLRRQIAMVLQPSLVFPSTIRENIAYGKPDAALPEIISAARLASIHDSIIKLPRGYDTVIGEQGATLSEGERQRITIARAILWNAPILILDEPTSSVDSLTEARIMDGLHHLMAGRTTFIIAHRLSTVREADLIVVLQGGEIVEAGTFAELLRAHGPFASLYRTQFNIQDEERNFRLVK